MSKVIERMMNVEHVEDLIAVFGSFDENIRKIEDTLGVQIVNRGNELKVSGDEEMVDKALRTLEGLLTLAAKGETIDEQRVRYLITLVSEGNDAQVAQMAKDEGHHEKYRYHRCGSRRYRQDLPGRGRRGGRLP